MSHPRFPSSRPSSSIPQHFFPIPASSTTSTTSSTPATFRSSQPTSNPSSSSTHPPHPNPNRHQAILTHPPSQLIAPPLISLATYASLLITAFSALLALILASYGLSAWDDAKLKFFGFRHLLGRGLDAGKELVGAVTSTAFPQLQDPLRTTIPRRTTAPAPPPEDHSSHIPSSLDPNLKAHFDPPSSSPAGYELPNDDDHHRPIGDPTEETHPHDSRSADSSSSSSSTLGQQPQPNFPPRPPLSVLIASLVLTLIVLTARLMVVWWMGQQAQKNSTQAFRNAQRAYEAATQEEENKHHHHQQQQQQQQQRRQQPEKDDDDDDDHDTDKADHPQPHDHPLHHRLVSRLHRRHHSSTYQPQPSLSTSTISSVTHRTWHRYSRSSSSYLTDQT